MALLWETFLFRFFTFLKAPLICYLRPVILELNESRMVLKIPLRRRSKNHLGAMYFGALCIGAENAAGVLALKLIRDHGNKVNLIFKDFQAQFLKRAEGDVHFICEEAPSIKGLIEKTMNSSDRQSLTVPIQAFVPKLSSQEPVAKFSLTLSCKKKKD